MSDKKKLKINIFGKDYSLLVDNEEFASQLAYYLDDIMIETKKEMPEQTNETVAVLAALNITYDLFTERNNFKEFSIQSRERIKKIQLLLSQNGLSIDQ
jgi:cell division protein ZapA